MITLGAPLSVGSLRLVIVLIVFQEKWIIVFCRYRIMKRYEG